MVDRLIAHLHRLRSLSSERHRLDDAMDCLLATMQATGCLSPLPSLPSAFSHDQAPAVTFYANSAVASNLERVIRAGFLGLPSSLHVPWTVKGVFDEDYELGYVLSSPCYDARAATLWGPLDMALDRSNIISDLKWIEQRIRQCPDLSDRGALWAIAAASAPLRPPATAPGPSSSSAMLHQALRQTDLAPDRGHG